MNDKTLQDTFSMCTDIDMLTRPTPGQSVQSNRCDHDQLCCDDERANTCYADAHATVLMNQTTRLCATPPNITTKIACCSGLLVKMTNDHETNVTLHQTRQDPQQKKMHKHVHRRGRLLNDEIDRPFACLRCDARFSMKHNMRRHIIVNHEGGTLKQYQSKVRKQCDKCEKNFSTKEHLQKHRKVYHDVKLRFACEKCDQSFYYRKALSDHENTHTGNRPYACSKCDARFMCYMTCLQHKLVHSGDRPRGNICNKCDERFRYAIQLYKHQRVCTGKKCVPQNVPNVPAQCESASLEQEGITEQYIAGGTNTADPLCCDKCGKRFKKEHYLKQHIKNRHGDRNSFICSKCGIGFPAFERLRTHEESKHNKKVKTPCKDCGKLLKTARALSLHRRLHAGCPVCDEKFTMIRQVLSHACAGVAEVHECHLCILTFATLNELKLHRLSNEHYMNKPYVCMECSRRYAFQSDMEKHQQKHYVVSTPSPLVCSQCPLSFFNSVDLHLHQQFHIKISNGAPAVKAKANSSNSVLVAQPCGMDGKRLHVCRYCNKSFRSIRNFKLHQRTHSGQKCFLCVECDRRFISLRELIEHETSHDDYKEKVKSVNSLLIGSSSTLKETRMGIAGGFTCYICWHCDAIFERQSALKVHRLAKHGDGNQFFDDDVDDKSTVQDEIRRLSEFCVTSEINS